MEEIKNLSIYNDGMAKSLDDKLFFIPVIGEEITQFEDFGCADGTLLEAVHNYDNKIGAALKKGSCLNLSSVLHEVNSYCTEEERKDFWDIVSCGDYDYIAVRDMIYNGDENAQSDPMDVGRVYEVVRKGDKDLTLLKEFEDIWGNLYLNKNLIHYFLKYRYVQNWEREVKENYLGYSTDDIIKLVGDEYEVIYRKDYILPFLYNRVEEDFGIKINTPTHTNLIFKRK